MRVRMRVRKISAVKLVAIPLLCSLPVGCSWLFGEDGHFRDRSMDYKRSDVAPPVKVATDEPTRPMESVLKIPNASSKQAFEPKDFGDVPRPRVVLKLAPNAEIELHREHGVDALIVDRLPVDVERWVVSYWQEKEITLSQPTSFEPVHGESVPGEREYISAWISEKQLGIEKGAVSSTFGALKNVVTWSDRWHQFHFTIREVLNDERADTEVVIGHRFSETRKPPQINVGDAGDMESVEPWRYVAAKNKWLQHVQQEFGEYMVSQTVQQSVAESKQASGPIEAVITNDGNGYPSLHVQQIFAQAWVTVGRAIQKSGIQIDDINRSLAIFYIDLKDNRRYADQLQQMADALAVEAKDAKLSKKEKKEKEKAAAEGAQNLPKFEVKLSRTESGIQVSLQKDDETLAPIALSEAFLRDVKRKIK